MNKKSVMLVDGHGLIFRAFYAVPELNGPDGTPTNAIHGFFNMFCKMKKQWKPEKSVVVFDAPGPTFRNELYSDYKKDRKPTPEELKIQLPILQDILKLLGIPVVSIGGVEADDVIASMALGYASDGYEALVVTSDKDILQVLGPGIRILRPGKGLSNFKEWDETFFVNEYGFPPRRMADYLALVGDKIDNVPGVPGVGDKTARKLLIQYGDLEGILSHLDELKPAQMKKFQDNLENVHRSLELTSLKMDDYLEPAGEIFPDRETFLDMCKKYGLRSLEAQVKLLINGSSPSASSESEIEVEDVVMNLSDMDEPGESKSLSPEQVPKFSDVPDLTPVDSENLFLYDRLAIHVEWTGDYPMGLEVKEIALCSHDGSYWKGDHFPEGLLNWLSKGEVVLSDYKRFYAATGTLLSDCRKVWDLRSAHYLMHPDHPSHSLEAALEENVIEEIELQAANLWQLRERLDYQLGRKGLLSLMRNIDLPLVPVLVEMERSGIKLDVELMEKTVDDLEQRLGDIRNAVTDVGGVAVNLNSPKQVGNLLFDVLGLPPVKKTKTGYSTNVTVLEKLAELPEPDCVIPRMLLEYRELSKMLSGFAVPLLKSATEDGIIHSTFEADTTGTGRLSSRDPNLQNLPVYGEWSDRIRKALLPKKEGNCFVAADYSQVELRVLSHICGESRLIDIFKSGRDIHTETAAMVFGVNPEFVTKELRRYAKTVSFGLLYGMSAFGLASRLGVSRTEAKDIIGRYFKALPGVEAYIAATYDMAMDKGYTQTLAGRIRPLDEVMTGNARDSGHIKRVAVNSPIQGTASDLAKEAMISVSNLFRDDDEVSMVLQVHDSIVCECPEGRRDEVLFRLSEAMEEVAQLSVPLKTDGKSGFSLADV